MVSRYHKGGGHDEPIVFVVAQVEGIGLMLQILRILEGGRSACLFVFGQHKLRQQHWNFIVLGLLAQILQPTLLLTRLPPLSNLHTISVLEGTQLQPSCSPNLPL